MVAVPGTAQEVRDGLRQMMINCARNEPSSDLADFVGAILGRDLTPEEEAYAVELYDNARVIIQYPDAPVRVMSTADRVKADAEWCNERQLTALVEVAELVAESDGIAPISVNGRPGVNGTQCNALVRRGLATRHREPVNGYALTARGWALARSVTKPGRLPVDAPSQPG